MCGTGKTNTMIDIMRKEKESKWLYITPYLKEIDNRLLKELPNHDFKQPLNIGKGKLESLRELVGKGYNIASTHALFGVLDKEIVGLLIEKGYKLVIDEAIKSVGLLNVGLNASDFEALIHSGMTTIEGDRGKLVWNEDEYPEHEGKYKEVRNMCQLDMLYAFDNTFLMYEYPPKLLENLEDVYILTYLFQGSDMRCWLDINQLAYQYLDTDELGLVPDSEVKKQAKELVTFYKSNSLKKVYKKLSPTRRKNMFSTGWYSKAGKEGHDTVKKLLRACVVGTKVKKGDVFWTCLKEYQNKVKGAGYSLGIRKDIPPFLPLNTRATNDYKNHTLCMYAANVFKNPIEVRYLESLGVKVDQDTFALSELIQFVWRGAVRQGKPMTVFILSERMENLLEYYLIGQLVPEWNDFRKVVDAEELENDYPLMLEKGINYLLETKSLSKEDLCKVWAITTEGVSLLCSDLDIKEEDNKGLGILRTMLKVK